MSTAPSIEIDSRLDGDALATIADDVRAGLGAGPPHTLPPKYFYDERGSELFEQITELDDYYPTRAERAILNRHAPAIMQLANARELVELGSGSASKTHALLYAMAGAGALDRYLPVDCSRAPIERCAEELTEAYPGLEVHGLIGDFERDLVHLPPPRDRRLVAFLGGTIGNFEPGERARMLRAIRAMLRRDDRLLLGTDLVKDAAVLERAYDDSRGVTAAFNLNVLTVLNRELDANFDLDAWRHVARWNAEEQWIEMRLRAVRHQRVELPGAEIAVDFRAGDEIRTEISAKFTHERIMRELADAGLRVELLVTDPDGLFALSLAAPV
ncbi:MAG: L-histidine Nalpha-methyltransferase [Thermoleophilales bacterium]|nr:L-histidine Nalpha-methyltransferase [Thermoleophilales bacterium]